MSTPFRPKTQLRIMHRNRKDKTHPKRGDKLTIGFCGLKMTTKKGCEITEFQLEACRKAIQNCLRRQGKVICRISPTTCRGSLPVASRMGKGAATPSEFYIKVAEGQIVWEITGVSKELAQKALLLAMVRLPGTSKIIYAKNLHVT